MAKRGFKVMDSDIHVSEPPDLWERYLESEFKDRGPRLAQTDGGGPERIVVTEKALVSHAIEGRDATAGRPFPRTRGAPRRERSARSRSA